ncbi:WD40-repeat-containing domain protein [Mycena galopus ATCC 62051]|nr:WD40-repeat-containing domain protein [Mycena galopus ATCC 62051]
MGQKQSLMISNQFHGGTGGAGGEGHGGGHGGQGGCGEGPIVHQTYNLTQVINKLKYAKEAGVQASKACLPGTRVELLTRIRKCALNRAAERILLLHGAAGTGKSAIAHTIARDLYSEGLALVPFFAFNRSVQNRSSSQLIPTWAKDLAELNSRYQRLRVCDLESTDLAHQRNVLFLKGLTSGFRGLTGGIQSKKPVILIIDALDECAQSEVHQLFLFLEELVCEPTLPSFIRFLFTYRPDGMILDRFKDVPGILDINIDDQDDTVEDICKFVNHQLCKTQYYTLDIVWPPSETLVIPEMGSVWAVAFSPDGKHFASASDHNIRMWDAETGQQVGKALDGHTDWVRSVAFSSDGRHIVSGSDDNTIRLWDVETGQQVGKALDGHTDWVHSVAFSSDGRHIVSGSGDKTIRLWDVETGQQVGKALDGHTDSVRSDAFSSDGRHIVSGSDDQTNQLWDVETWQQVGKALKGHTERVQSVAFSPDGRHIVSGSDDNTIRLWDVARRKQIGKPLDGHTDWVQSVAFSSDGRHIASGSDDKTIWLWDVETGQQVGKALVGHTDEVKSVAFSPDGRHIASGSRDNTIRIWDVEMAQHASNARTEQTGVVSSVVFSPEDGWFYTSQHEHQEKPKCYEVQGVTLMGYDGLCPSFVVFPSGVLTIVVYDSLCWAI